MIEQDSSQKEFWELKESFKDHSMNDERNFKAIRDDMHKGFQEMNEGLEKMALALQPLTEAYTGLLFSRKFIIGIASMILAISAVGASVIWVINASINKN